MGVSLGERVGQLQDVGRVGLVGYAQAIDKRPQHHYQQPDEGALAELAAQLEQLGGSGGLGNGKPDRYFGQELAGFGVGGAGQLTYPTC